MFKTSIITAKSLASARPILLVLAASLVAFIVIVECKPRFVRIIKMKEPEDPLMALPTGESSQYDIQAPPQQEVHYILQATNDATGEQQVQYQQPQETIKYQPAATNGAESPRQEIHYVYKTEHQFEATPEVYAQYGNDNQKTEYVNPSEGSNKAQNGDAESLPREYPGEILYVGQNGEPINGIQGLIQNQSSSNMANLLTETSGLAATILTEIPVKDMPNEILEKLKKEYGVKVVATREHPGANLVINCDDQLSQEGSICAKPSAYAPQNSELVYPPGEEHVSDVELPQDRLPVAQPKESVAYELENNEPPRGTYTSRDEEIRGARENQANEDHYVDRRRFGTRNQANEESSYPNNSSDREYTNEEPAQADKSEAAQPETEDSHRTNYEQQPGNEEDANDQGGDHYNSQ